MLIIFCAIALVIFGCLQLVKKNSQEKTPEMKEPVISQADQEIIYNLMSRLNSNVINYEASYKRGHEYHYWGGHSGATDNIEETIISIKVINGQIINCTIRFNNSNPYFPVEYTYYNSETKLCERVIENDYSSCRLSETPIAPKMGGYVEGCKVNSDGGRHLCICNGNEKSISINENIEPKMPCKEPIMTAGFELWDEFNIIYYPETNQSLCYFVTKSEDNRFAFECQNKNIKLIPVLTYGQLKNLKNTVCRYAKYNHLCGCTFNFTINEICDENIPVNFDATAKSDILNYLRNIKITEKITEITEKDYEIGHCYSFLYNGLEHSFCFDEQNLITFAKWGKDSGQEGTINVDFEKIEKIQ